MADQDLLHTAEIMKAALPYIDSPNKVMVEFMMKVFELIAYVRTLRKSLSLAACGYEAGKIDMEGMLNSIKPVCNKKERDFIDKILNIFNMKRVMEMYNSMMEVMNAMQQDGEESSFDSSASFENSSDDLSSVWDFYKSDMDLADNDEDQTNDLNDDMPKTDESQTFDAGSLFEDTGSSGQNSSSGSSSSLLNDKMLDMLKAMVPPEKRSTFDNLSMLLSSMSYDNTSNPEEDKEQGMNG